MHLSCRKFTSSFSSSGRVFFVSESLRVKALLEPAAADCEDMCGENERAEGSGARRVHGEPGAVARRSLPMGRFCARAVVHAASIRLVAPESAGYRGFAIVVVVRQLVPVARN